MFGMPNDTKLLHVTIGPKITAVGSFVRKGCINACVCIYAVLYTYIMYKRQGDYIRIILFIDIYIYTHIYIYSTLAHIHDT